MPAPPPACAIPNNADAASHATRWPCRIGVSRSVRNSCKNPRKKASSATHTNKRFTAAHGQNNANQKKTNHKKPNNTNSTETKTTKNTETSNNDHTTNQTAQQRSAGCI